MIDPLDAYPPRWSLDENDCDARITEQGHANDAGAEGGRCETVTMLMSHGTKAVLVYPIEPVRPIDALTATISVKGLSRGIRIGFRVRFPYLIDPQTKRPAALLVYGSSYDHIGEFQRLGVSDIDRDLKLKRVALRNQFGARADVSSPYVDAVVMNAYGGPGNHTLRLDLLKIEAMVPLIDDLAAAHASGKNADALAGTTMRDPNSYDSRRQTFESLPELAKPIGTAFPVGRVTRILQHNGEPLAWVRSLGFDSVWMSQPPNASILSEAIAARMKIYAPAPSSPDESLAPLLEPVAGWIVGVNRPMDSTNVADHEDDARRLRNLPVRWRRPLVGCPVESFREYASMLDAVVLDAPPRVRNLSSAAIKAIRGGQSVRMSGKPMAVGISGMANHIASLQTDAIAARIGTPPREGFLWHGMWRQVADALGDAPDAILIRSTTPLSGGTPLQQNRAMSLSFVNRFSAALEQWVSGATVQPEGELIRDSESGLPIYFAHRVSSGPTTLLIMTTAMGRGDAAIAGDGKSISIRLPPADEGKLIWRLTHFSAERVTPQTDLNGTTVSIVSPDVVEVIAISDAISEAGKIATAAQRFARQAAMDRWQLASEAINRSELSWNQAVAARVVTRSAPLDLIQVARSSLENAEQLVRSGQAESSLRMSRRADAWCAKSDWMLQDALLEGVHTSAQSAMSSTESNTGRFVSSPPVIVGDFETQVAWSPLLKTPVNQLSTYAPSVVNQLGLRSRWGANRIAGGDFERGQSLTGGDALEREGWTLGRRHSKWAEANASLIHRGAFSGHGALRLRVTPRGSDPLPGGYEGTCLMVRSPAVRLQEEGVVRIDAVVRTLGFANPHQGLLIYDSVGTQEMGVLVSDQPQWTPVTLFRQLGPDTTLHVMMEVIGGGEAIVDDIQVRTWETTANPAAMLRPLDPTLP
ncbi:hypothetical protein NB063_30715 [Rhodopirellula sp. ICT_H3.1]|uniref:Uncharacterized protein n=1 Tax=Aporhodopirellula aestuarii TaxID=2950107 RepID=A0ABT0UE06_9BACT|nr:hypothetical protein [Aporhodopirellula aestuarii]MCM2375017.1 hypothetical protein [Aporhodopirellula aestuarii]